MSVSRRDLLRLSGALALAAAVTPSPALARRVFPEDGASEFLVLRNDVVIGKRTLSVSRASGDLVVRQDIEFRVGPKGAAIDSFEQHSEEIWRDGWLHAVVSDTEDNGALWRVRAERIEGIFQGLVNGLAFTVSGYPITSTLWHRDTWSQQALLDVTDARIKLIRGHKLGEVALALPGGRIRATRYAIRGEINRDVWYDSDCRLVRVSQPLRDGSVVVSELA